jgi:hypothetical protein
MEDDFISIKGDLLNRLAGISTVNGNGLCVVSPCNAGKH